MGVEMFCDVVECGHGGVCRLQYIVSNNRKPLTKKFAGVNFVEQLCGL